MSVKTFTKNFRAYTYMYNVLRIIINEYSESANLIHRATGGNDRRVYFLCQHIVSLQDAKHACRL